LYTLYKNERGEGIITRTQQHVEQMIIPVKCYTCGKVIADKYRYYLNKVREKKLEEQGGGDVAVDKVLYLTKHNTKKTAEGQVLDDIGFTKMCCRRHFLTHVDIQ
jgi:DNA-directed RNA polymerase subunit N (RpoN/RPB10)